MAMYLDLFIIIISINSITIAIPGSGITAKSSDIVSEKVLEARGHINMEELLHSRKYASTGMHADSGIPPEWVIDACTGIDPSGTICQGLFHRFHEVYSMDGDVILAGLFPIHQSEGCLDLEDMGSIQRMEAMAYAVKKVNSWSFMKNLTLGFRIYDTCNSQSIALSRTLGVLPHCNNCSHFPVCFPECPPLVAGVVGPESSSNTLLSAHACNLALTPIISYFATSLELTDTSIFPTLFTTVPSDDYQVSAMLDLLNFFGWSYFSFIHTDDRYGKDALDYVQMYMKEMCLASVQQVSSSSGPDLYDDVVANLLRYKQESRTSVVIVFTDGIAANKLFYAVDRANATGEFVWIGSEGWGVSLNDISANLHVAQGAVTFTPHTENDPEFDEYFQNLNVTHDNPWWKEIWQEHFQCSWIVGENDENSCWSHDHIDATNGYVSDSTVSLVNDAVYAFAYAISDYVNNTDHLTDRHGNVIIPPWKLVDYIRKISFPGSALGRDISLGDSNAYYDINNLQITDNGTFDYVKVGSWDSKVKLVLDSSAIQWPGHKQTPISYCSDFCRLGEVQVLVKIACCWDCEKCSEGSIVVNNTRCQPCNIFYWPNANFSKCEQLEFEYLRWYEAPAILLAVFGCLVLLCALLSAAFYIKHRHDRLVKASGRELMSVIMLGIIVQGTMVFLILSEPTAITCFIYRFIFGLDLTISYAAIVIKSNRIYRIFSHGMKSAAAPKWTKTHHQLIMTGAIILIQIVIISALCFVYPPVVQKYQTKPGLAEIACSLENNITILLPLSYNFLLILPCLYYGWKTRYLPANYNESRFIAFTVSTTLVVWIAFIPTYLTVGTSQDTSSKIHVEILATVEIMSSFNTLACLFFPKIYAVMFVPTESWHVASFKKKSRRNRTLCASCGTRELGGDYKSTFTNISNVPFIARESMNGTNRLGLRRASSAGDATRSTKMTKSKKVEFAENDITMQRKLSASVPNIKSLMTSQREAPKLPRSKTTMTEKDLKSDKTDTTLSPLIELPSVELKISTPRLKRRNSNRHLKLDASIINSTNKAKPSSFLSPFGSDDRRVSNVSSVSNIDVIKGSVTDNYLCEYEDAMDHPNLIPNSPVLNNSSVQIFDGNVDSRLENNRDDVVNTTTTSSVLQTVQNESNTRVRSSSDAATIKRSQLNSSNRRGSIPAISIDACENESPRVKTRVLAYSVTKMNRRQPFQ